MDLREISRYITHLWEVTRVGAVTEQASRGREMAPIERKCQSVIILNDVRGAADANCCCCCAFAAHSSGFVSKFPEVVSLHFIFCITHSNCKFDLLQPSCPPLSRPLIGGVTSLSGSERMKNSSAAAQRRRGTRQQKPANTGNF